MNNNLNDYHTVFLVCSWDIIYSTTNGHDSSQVRIHTVHTISRCTSQTSQSALSQLPINRIEVRWQLSPNPLTFSQVPLIQHHTTRNAEERQLTVLSHRSIHALAPRREGAGLTHVPLPNCECVVKADDRRRAYVWCHAMLIDRKAAYPRETKCELACELCFPLTVSHRVSRSQTIDDAARTNASAQEDAGV